MSAIATLSLTELPAIIDPCRMPRAELPGTGCRGARSTSRRSGGRFGCRRAHSRRWYRSSTGQFDAPAGVAVDGSGNVFVAETYNDRLQKFDNIGFHDGPAVSFDKTDTRFLRAVRVGS